MRFSADFLDEIRDRLPISSVVGQRVSFHHKKSMPSKGDFWACCPFHMEKTPSFHCEDRKGRYHCFGCGASGDIFRFVCEVDGLSFPEAVELLAEQAGIKMPARDVEAEKKEKAKADLYDVMEMATQYFEQALWTPEGAEARAYLNMRTVPRHLGGAFRIGFAPNGRMGLKDALMAKGVGVAQMVECGLLVTGDDIAVPYDRFRNRIMFPIEDLRGRIVGFGGRALDGRTRAEYLNSSETALFHKGHLLYNGGRARKACQPAQGQPAAPLIVVEGYMDVIALAKVGVDTAVAPLGTALTEEQIELLWRISSEPILCFDGDEAGLKAAFRAAQRILPLLKTGVSMRFVLLPEGKDPDDIVRVGGREAILQALQGAMGLSQLLWQWQTMGKRFETPEERAALEGELKRMIFTIRDESLRHYYLQDVRERLRTLFRPVFTSQKAAYGKQAKNNAFQGRAGEGQSTLAQSHLVRKSNDFLSLREAMILLTLVSHPALLQESFETVANLEFESKALVELHLALLDVMGTWQPDDGQAMMELLDKKGQGAILKRVQGLIQKSGLRSASRAAPIEDAREALKQAVHLHHRAHNLHKRLREIEAQLLETPENDVFVLLRDIKRELEQTEATEALIEGFGAWKDEENDQNTINLIK